MELRILVEMHPTSWCVWASAIVKGLEAEIERHGGMDRENLYLRENLHC